MEGGEECSSNESGWTKYIDPTSEYDDQNNYNSGFVHDDDDDDDDAHHNHHHHHHGYNRRQRKEDDDDGDSIASDASSGPRHHHGEEEDDADDDGSKFFKGMKSTKVVKGTNTEKYEGKGKKDMMLKMKKSTGYGFKQRQGQKPI